MKNQAENHILRLVDVRPESESSVVLWPLYGAALVAAFCGVAYELLLASYATFLMGASIFQYSLVISLMMASMGVGALLSQKFLGIALEAFLITELILTILALTALPTMYYVFAQDQFPHVVLVTFVALIGGALGMEIPLLNELTGTQEGLARILFFDYLGGFVGGVLFPILLVPMLGFFPISAVLGLLNAVTGLVVLIMCRRDVNKMYYLWLTLTAIVAVAALGDLIVAEPLRRAMEQRLFQIFP